MSIQQLASGRWRAQVHDKATGKNVSVGTVTGGPSVFDTKREAKRAREKAREILESLSPSTITVAEWREIWINDPLYTRPKLSTNIHNAERTKHFAEAHGGLLLRAVDDMVVARWLSGGKRNGQVPSLKAMFNDAASAKAGRLIDRNPWAGLRLAKSRGQKDKHPPAESLVLDMIEAARLHTSPSFAAWLAVAAYTGLRPGELDALTWDDVDLEAERISVRRQWSSTSRTFSLPKNGNCRTAIITPRAAEALASIPREGVEYCFASPRRSHLTPSSRAPYWKAVRAATGYTDSLYLATRHFFGWYATNVLLLASEDVAIAMGHVDGGHQVRTLYGHRDRSDALDRTLAAFKDREKVVDLASRRASS